MCVVLVRVAKTPKIELCEHALYQIEILHIRLISHSSLFAMRKPSDFSDQRVTSVNKNGNVGQ